MAESETTRVNVFVSYSHKDQRWLDRLQVHLTPLTREYDIDLWDDTRLKPGSIWREEIRSAVDKADAAVLIISADFLASEFVSTNELPPLLKAAEEEGALILPMIVSPSLFHKNPDLSRFQAVNNPSTPLVSASRGEQESVLVRVAEALLERAATVRTQALQAVAGSGPGAIEAFFEHSTWTRLIRIGGWIIDEERQRIIGSGMRTYLLSRKEFGNIPFVIQTRLEFTNFQVVRENELGMNAGVIFGWKAEKESYRCYNILLTGTELLVERVGFEGGSETQDFEHITDPTPLPIEKGKSYEFEVRVGADMIEIDVNNERVLSLKRPKGVEGRVGLRPWRSKMDCTTFIVMANPSGQ